MDPSIDLCYLASRLDFHTVDHLIFVASKFGDFKRLTYWHSLILALSQLNAFLTLNPPIRTKVVCFSRLLKCLRSLYGKQCGPRSDCSYRSSLAVCSGSTLFASILNLSVMLGNYLQQTPSADNILRCVFFLGALRVKSYFLYSMQLLLKERICSLNHFIFTASKLEKTDILA